jgi:4-hydroxy-tetrahydrodipicolinate synthase
MISKFFGTGVALITPFEANGNMDYTALTKLVEFVSTGGVNYLVLLGTTAETPTLTTEEKSKILSCVKSVNKAKLPIMVGIGGNNTLEVVDKIKHSDFSGVDALLSVAPYYNKPSQQGMYAHYTAIADASPVPVMLYNVPSRTGVNLAADTTLRLAQHKNIFGTKEASGNLSQMGCILRDKPKDFLVVSGDDGLTLPLMSIGGQGVISVAANAFPKQISSMVSLAQAQKYDEAAKIHLQMMELIDALFAEGNPVGIKAALAVQGMISNILRLPLVPASAALMDKIRKLTA